MGIAAQLQLDRTHQRSAPLRTRRRDPIRSCREDLRKLQKLKLTEWKIGLVSQRSTYRRGSKEISDSLLAERCGIARSSVSLAKQSLESQGLASWLMAPWQKSKCGMITCYHELAQESGTEIPFEFVDRLLPLIRAQAVRRVAEAMLIAMSGGKHSDVFATGELLALTGIDKRKLHPALKSEVFERVGHGRYRLALRDWKPTPKAPTSPDSGRDGLGFFDSSVSSSGRRILPSVGSPSSRARAASVPAPRPGGRQNLREIDSSERSCPSQDVCTHPAGRMVEVPSRSNVHAGSRQARLPFKRGWNKPSRTAADLIALHAAMTRQAPDLRMARHLRFWIMRSGGYERVRTLIYWAVTNWTAVQDRLDLLDAEPTMEVLYNYRDAIGRMQEHESWRQEHPREAATEDRLERKRQRQAEREHRRCRAQYDRERKAEQARRRDEIGRKLKDWRQQLEQARRDVGKFSHSPHSVPSRMAMYHEREAQRAIEALTDQLERIGRT